MKRLKVKKIIPILLMVIFIIATFGGCVEEVEPAMWFDEYEDLFFEELAKIPKEVEGYAIVEASEKQKGWEGASIEKNGIEYSFVLKEDMSFTVYIGMYKNNEFFKDIKINDYTKQNKTMQEIWNICSKIGVNPGRDSAISMSGIKLFDDKIFIVTTTNYNAQGWQHFEIKKWWPPLLFVYDIDTDTMQYAGYIDTRPTYNNGKYFPYTYIDGYREYYRDIYLEIWVELIKTEGE